MIKPASKKPASRDAESVNCLRRPRWSPHQAGAPDNACTSCHRAQCDTNFAVPLGELVMSAPFADSTAWAEHSGDRRELRDWCESLPSRGECGGGEEEEEGALPATSRSG